MKKNERNCGNFFRKRLSLKIFVPVFLCFSLLGFSSLGQSKSELQKKKEQLQQEIELMNRILEDTRKNKNVSLNQLVTLNKKISARAELINTINSEIAILQNHIEQTNSVIDALEADLKKLKEEYAKMIYFANKNRSAYERMMFIFSSKDFNQAYKRLRYLQQYSDYRKTQKELIEKTQLKLTDRRFDLVLKKAAKTELLSSIETERGKLNIEKVEQISTVETLQKKEKVLKSQLAEKQKAEQKLNKAIEDIIRKEIDAARKKAEKEGKTVANNEFALTPEAQKLSNDFASNRGKLPWPVEQGVITETFGVHPHPMLKGIETNNNGIDIGSSKGTQARAVFDGEVSAVLVMPTTGKAVLIRHGEYLTVYSNLDEVFVKTGQKVTTKQNLGIVSTNEDDSKTQMNFQIWKLNVKMNPEQWLFRKK